MRKLFWAVCLVLSPALLAQGLPDNSRHIAVTGYGKVIAEADEAKVTFRTTSTQPRSADAKRDVDIRVNELLDILLSDLRIDQDDIVASGISLQPEYEYSRNERLFKGFRANRAVTVTLRDLDGLNTLLDTALGARVDEIASILFQSSDEEAHRAKARERAIADSKEKAEALASAYDATLGPVYSIHYQQPQVQPMVVERAMMAADAASALRPGRYVGHMVTFEDRVNVVFMLAD
ncbi:MAG: DUF541 domain-containing protein [Gammaproteobacteria bacterium]|nr:MAG: DUF541 domain-containing protein [Gammaproteobacteria bacterium]